MVFPTNMKLLNYKIIINTTKMIPHSHYITLYFLIIKQNNNNHKKISCSLTQKTSLVKNRHNKRSLHLVKIESVKLNNQKEVY